MERPLENTNVVREPAPVVSSHPKTISVVDKTLSLEKLQRKAQELLNIERTSTSDISSTSDENILKTKINKPIYDKKISEKNQKESTQKSKNHNRRKKTKINLSTSTNNRNDSDNSKKLKLGNHKEKLALNENVLVKKENGSIILPGSPVKVIRAKITEEVNNRLAKLGVDPLKSRLPQNIFQKQRTQIHEHQELKFKKNPNRELVLHSLLAHLDLKATKLNKDTNQPDSDNFSTKTTKPFSFASVISNVKTKALSLVKTNDMTKNIHKSYDDVAKKAMFLLKTPPSSTHSSPKILIREKSPVKIKSKNKESIQENPINIKNNESDTELDISNQEYYDRNQPRNSTSIENIKSPARSSSQNSILNYSINARNKAILNHTPGNIPDDGKISENKENSSDDVESLVDQSPRKALSEENILKQTKGVLKNASSTSSLNKKKVIFDMDAIQMKSVSASSPSQSIITEKSDTNEKYQQGQGIVNFNNEEWDISSIENEPVQQSNQSKTISRTTPRIAELKQTIESQLMRRNNTLPSGLVGSVDVLTGGTMKKSAIGGSNTSLGSSILDDTDNVLVQNKVAFVKPKFIEKDDSEMDILSSMKL